MPAGSSTEVVPRQISRLQLLPILVGKLASRSASELKRFAVPFSRRLIRFPQVSGFYSASQRGCYYFRPERQAEMAAAWRNMFDCEAKVVEAADEICRHVFDLLGSGKSDLGDEIDWHTDFKSGKSWSSHRALRGKEIAAPGTGADIKVPWELSRFQHLSTLGKAYWLTTDEKYPREFVGQIASWIDKNPWGRGPNWACTMEVGIRAANWILGYTFFEPSRELDDGFRQKMIRSLWEHGWFVEHNLERGRTNSNHYLSDLAGLFAVGVFFSGCERGRRWRDFAFGQMCTEMRRQVLADGVDYEKSVGYHRLVLELFTYTFRLACLNGIAIPEDVQERWMRMFEFTSAYTKPDGTAPQVGDSDDGMFYKLHNPAQAPVTPSPGGEGWGEGAASRSKILPAELSSLASPFTDHRYLLSLGALIFDRGDLAAQADAFAEEAFWIMGPDSHEKFRSLCQDEAHAPPSKGFEAGGFYVIRSDRHYAIIDAGDNGRGGLGGHSHNDTLSFELYAFDKTFIVDPGSYLYTADPQWRNRFRSTAYHNTVMIDGQEIHPYSERWLFGLPDAGVVRVTRWDVGEEEVVLAAEHDAYNRLKGPVTHRRTVEFDKVREVWRIVDEFEGSGRHLFESRLHFGPGIDLKPVPDSPGCYETACNGANLRIEPSSENDFEAVVEDGWYSPSYGRREPINVLKYLWRAEAPCLFTVLCRAAGWGDK